LKEVEVYQGVLALLYRTKAQMDEQIRCIDSTPSCPCSLFSG